MICFVLTGGNTKGAFQAGAIKSLSEEGINPDVIVGTSIGAINAYTYSYLGIDGLIKQWQGVNSRANFLRLNWRGLFWKGIYDLEPTRKQLIEVAKGETKSIKTYAAVLNRNTGATEYISSDDPRYLDGTLGSAAEPVFMKPIGSWIDAGIREFAAIDFAKTLNPKKIIIISTRPNTGHEPIKPTKVNLYNQLKLATDVMSFEVGRNDVNSCKDAELIAPKEPLHGSYDFGQDGISKDLERGIQAGNAYALRK